ncbi:nicotinate (nicotinamide) nucleotide adenylyltransferase [Erysipelothrix sp. HDW6C]|uniref:nicotinate (nicotinamide) nucleotide adenylyltransferase n=1 Tax=Erysipelothrix sp. HDW6C TaxID=2714930 RepID=UPI00140CA375|nr:nicotinate (nicotinamide) nucleotide adenylyltransferase [Erysipelothrix sp. HDW6C]QIK70125.1 nicotinate (nicotinamide) nucleotide adenylyltransferase [Erysipelothrix sp. HDW6C]
MRHVILFGGSFDPIHYGHLEMAKQALRQRHADELWFIPSKLNPFKTGSSSFEDRVAMIKMMTYGFDSFRVETIENSLPSPSYSIDTVNALRKLHPDTVFDWLIGADQLPRMHEWKSFDTLKEKVNFIVYARDQDIVDSPYPLIVGALMDVSSTAIRNGHTTQTKPSILRYMMEKGLYLEVMIRSRLSEFRAEHVIRVRDLALEIGEHYGLKKETIALAAMCHDLCKEDSLEDLTRAMRASYPDKISLAPAIYHGFAAAHELSTRYYIRNKQVLSAIRGHVTGASHHPLGMILYIADKCERGRPHDNEALIALSKVDLNAAFRQLKRQQAAYEQRKRSTHE